MIQYSTSCGGRSCARYSAGTSGNVNGWGGCSRVSASDYNGSHWQRFALRIGGVRPIKLHSLDTGKYLRTLVPSTYPVSDPELSWCCPIITIALPLSAPTMVLLWLSRVLRVHARIASIPIRSRILARLRRGWAVREIDRVLSCPLWCITGARVFET